MDAKDLRDLIIIPTLEKLSEYDPRMNSPAAVNLLLGTCAQESDMGFFIKQIRGPALGWFQVEPATHDSLWEHYLGQKSKRPLARLVTGLAAHDSIEWGDDRAAIRVDHAQLLNPFYATAIARIKFWTIVEPLPEADDLESIGKYWDTYYNANPNAGTVMDFLASWNLFIAGDIDG